ncbi:MAG: carbohydrate ABC transporter permease [Anaerolineae bacterium]
MSNNALARSALPATRRLRLAPIMFVLPAILILFFVTIVPFLVELFLSLNILELTAPAPPRFVWLKNFADILFNDPRFWGAMKNTFILIVFGVGIQLVMGTGLALLLNRLGRTRTFVTSLFLIPVMIAPVVSGMQWVMIYDDKFGPLNYLCELLLGFRGFAWVADPGLALISVIVTDIWQWTPFIILIALSGLQAIPIELYEAAEVDGSSAWQSLWYITLPLLIPVLVIAVLIRFMDSFKLFDIIFLLTRGGPGSSTETISFYTYLRGFKQFSIGYTAALAFIQLIVITIIAKIFLSLQERQRGR